MRGGVVFGRVFLMVGVILLYSSSVQSKRIQACASNYRFQEFIFFIIKCVFVNRVEIGIADIKGLFWKLGSHRVSQSGYAKG